jgi:hypothetical protein
MNNEERENQILKNHYSKLGKLGSDKRWKNNTPESDLEGRQMATAKATYCKMKKNHDKKYAITDLRGKFGDDRSYRMLKSWGEVE